MKKRCQKSLKALALLIVFSLLPFSSGLALAAPGLQATGKLTTKGNQPVMVNGIPTTSGATILSGANIETGDMVGATIHLGALGKVDIAPNTKLQLTFSSDGTVRVTLVEGCLILHVRQGTYGVINTSGGEVAHNDSTQRRAAVLDVCLPKGAPEAIVNQGAASNAGAGVGTTGGTVAEEGFSSAVVASLITGGTGLGILLLVLINRGDDPSASA